MDSVLNQKEIDSLDRLNQRHKQLTTPNQFVQLAEKGMNLVPKEVKSFVSNIGNTLSEQELYKQCLEQLGTGFKVVLEQASKFSVNKESILKDLRKVSQVRGYEEITTLRSYDIAKVVATYKTKDLALAFSEGAITGFAGFAGLPFNLVLSNFLYFRAVQAIAMYYGYDIQNDSGELVLASTVFSNALSPSQSLTQNDLSAAVTKLMLISKATIVGQTAKKGWADMAGKNSVTLLLTQIRALSNKQAQKALAKAGQKGLENTLFKEVFELMGKKITQKAIEKSIPYISAGISALIDTAQMNQVLEYADVFYQMRFITEKEQRIEQLRQLEKEQVVDAIYREL